MHSNQPPWLGFAVFRNVSKYSDQPMTTRRFSDQEGWIKILDGNANVLWAPKYALALQFFKRILELNKFVAGVLGQATLTLRG